MAAILVTLLMLGVPTMACLVSDGQFSSEERECCKHMADMCGRGSMPSSHSCCNTTVRASNDAILNTARVVLPTVMVAVAVSTFTEAASAEHGAVSLVAPSPPKSP